MLCFISAFLASASSLFPGLLLSLRVSSSHIPDTTLILLNVTREVIKPTTPDCFSLSCHASPIEPRWTINLKFRSRHLGNHIWLDPGFRPTSVPSVKLWPSGLWIRTCQNNIYHLRSGCCSPSAFLISSHPSLTPSLFLSCGFLLRRKKTKPRTALTNL